MVVNIGDKYACIFTTHFIDIFTITTYDVIRESYSIQKHPIQRVPLALWGVALQSRSKLLQNLTKWVLGVWFHFL